MVRPDQQSEPGTLNILGVDFAVRRALHFCDASIQATIIYDLVEVQVSCRSIQLSRPRVCNLCDCGAGPPTGDTCAGNESAVERLEEWAPPFTERIAELDHGEVDRAANAL